MTRFETKKDSVHNYHGVWDTEGQAWHAGKYDDATYGAGVPMWRSQERAQEIADTLNEEPRMTTNVPASLITVEFAETMLAQAGASYRAANRDLHRYGLLASALLVRRHFPSASHIVVDESDQGPYVCYRSIIDPTATTFDDDEIPEDEIDDISGEQLWESLQSWLGDLSADDPFGHWLPFLTQEGGEPFRRRKWSADYGLGLDIDLILFHEGDAEPLLAEMLAEANA